MSHHAFLLALADGFPLLLAYRRYDVQEQAAGRGVGIEGLSNRYDCALWYPIARPSLKGLVVVNPEGYL